MLGDKKRGLISNPRKKSSTNINLGRGAVSPLMFKHVRTFKTCTETWEGRNLSPDSQAMPDRHLENFELSIPSDCQDCNRTQTLGKQSKLQPNTLDRTPALVPVFGFSLAFPSFLLLTLGGPRDTPHWTKLSPARFLMTGRILPDLTTCRLQETQLSRQTPFCQSRGSNTLTDHETSLQQPFLHSSNCLKKARQQGGMTTFQLEGHCLTKAGKAGWLKVLFYWWLIFAPLARSAVTCFWKQHALGCQKNRFSCWTWHQVIQQEYRDCFSMFFN